MKGTLRNDIGDLRRPRHEGGLVQDQLAHSFEIAALLALIAALFALYKERGRLARAIAAMHVVRHSLTITKSFTVTEANKARINYYCRGISSQQLGVLSFGLPVDGNVGIGCLPDGQEVLIRCARFIAGGGIVINIERVSASQTEAG